MTQAAAPAKPARLPRSEDPRNPNFRLAALFDEGSLKLISPDDDSGMLAATGTINGSPAVSFCSDATVMGGAMGLDGCEVVVQAYRRAMVDRVPIIGIWHSGGARLAEGVLSLHAVGRIFHAMTQASGKIPQISVVLGAAAGGAAYGPALTDVVILAPDGRIFVTGPDVVRSVTGEDVDMLRLGGPDTHERKSGVVHVVADDEADALGPRPRGHHAARGTGRGDLGRCRRRPGRAAAGVGQARLRRAPADRRPARRGFAVRVARPLGAQRDGRLRPPGWTHGRRRREQPAATRWLPRLPERGEGRPVRPAVRRVRRPAGRAGGRARLPARRRPGVGRCRPPRREAAARVLRGVRAAGDAGDAQGLRRRLHRHELALARRHQGVRLAGARRSR